MLDLSEVITDVFEELNLPFYVETVEEEEESQTALDRWSWWLGYLAKASRRANRLERERVDFHADLYECIRYSSVPFDPLNPPRGSTATEAQAIRIIELKDRYEKKILKEYQLCTVWDSILSECKTEQERQLLNRYFINGERKDEEQINELLLELYKPIARLEEQIERERNERSTEECRVVS